MKKFKLLQGKHYDEKGKKYVAGDTITTHADLTAFDKERFELIGEVDMPKPAKQADSGGSGSDSAELGEDVTAEFESAVEADLKVFKNKGWFSVVDPDGEDPSEPINVKGLRADAVEAFIEEYLES